VGFSIHIPLIGNFSSVKMLHLLYTAQNLLFRIFYIVLFIVLLMQNVFDRTFGDIFFPWYLVYRVRMLQMYVLCAIYSIFHVHWPCSLYETCDWANVSCSSIDKKRKDLAELPSLSEHILSTSRDMISGMFCIMP
jgi:hypothetical protein